MKVPFDSLVLCATLAEMRPLLIGGQVQEARQPNATDILLNIRNQGRTHWLLLSTSAQFARMHLVQTRQANAPTLPRFCAILRKYLENAYIQEIEQVGFDRVVEIVIGTRSEEGERETVRLVAELMGKHSNLILLREDGTILDSMKRITHRINRVRETLPGLLYQPPPTQGERLSPFAPNALTPLFAEFGRVEIPQEKVLSDYLKENYAGVSPFLAQEIALRVTQAQEGTFEARLAPLWSEVFGKTAQGEFTPVSARATDGSLFSYPFPLVQFPKEAQERVTSLNFALERAFSQTILRVRFAEEWRGVLGQVEKERRFHERQMQSADKSLAEAARAESHKQTGELILANVWKLEGGETEVAVQDYFDTNWGDRTIPLDPKLSAQENAEVYFRRYHKAKEGAEMAEALRTRASIALLTLFRAEARLHEMEAAKHYDAEAVKALREELVKANLLRSEEKETAQAQKAAEEFQGHRIRRITTPEGFEILVGESATANDFLTTRLTQSNDIWLHVRASVSSHVIIRTKGQPAAVPRSVLEQAALLCARHSVEKHSSLVPVDYTLKKYVRKPRGSAPGSVDYERETTLHVSPVLR